MIRRAHQIATSIFLETTAALGATTTQYGVMTILSNAPGIDQITLARRLGLDRSTAGTVIKNLEQGGFVGRVVGPDRRTRCLELTASGHERLIVLRECAEIALNRLLEPLLTEERESLSYLLRKLTTAHNSESRVPVMD
jgi:DNA-binding MarR family transcriptional regulator